MAQDNSMTLAIGGEVTLADLAVAVVGWADTVKALGDEVASGAPIDWVIEDLRPGSAVATVRGVSEKRDAVPRVVRAYEVVGQALAQGKPPPYCERVVRSALSILEVLNGRVTSVSFLTAESESVVTSRSVDQGARPTLRQSMGTLTGTVDTLSRRRGLRFNLYDDLLDEPVTCYLSAGQEDLMRDSWGKHVAVTGLITREPYRGRPISMRSIRQVRPLPDVVPGSFRQARGLVPVNCVSDRAETVIRRMRDAE